MGLLERCNAPSCSRRQNPCYVLLFLGMCSLYRTAREAGVFAKDLHLRSTPVVVVAETVPPASENNKVKEVSTDVEVEVVINITPFFNVTLTKDCVLTFEYFDPHFLAELHVEMAVGTIFRTSEVIRSNHQARFEIPAELISDPHDIRTAQVSLLAPLGAFSVEDAHLWSSEFFPKQSSPFVPVWLLRSHTISLQACLSLPTQHNHNTPQPNTPHHNTPQHNTTHHNTTQQARKHTNNICKSRQEVRFSAWA
jgi:hypothetical protein